MRAARTAVALTVTLAAALAAGCGLDPSPSPPASPRPPASSSPAPPASPSPPVPSSTSSAGSGAPGAATAADPGLFALIGGDSDQLDFRYDPDTTASVAADPGLAKDAKGLAIGLYTIRGQQPVVDYGIVSVLQLRDPAASDEWFRSYRDSYDESACAQAGGVARHAETELNGHTVFIGGCAGGAFTYHVRVRSGGIVVSITSVGPADLGTRLAGDVDRP